MGYGRAVQLLPRQITLSVVWRPSAASISGSANNTFSPVLLARCSSRIRSAGTPPDTMPSLMIELSVRGLPCVGPPLTMAWRKRPRCHSSTAFSAICLSPRRWPNTNSRSAVFSGVEIRCSALMRAISSWSSGPCASRALMELAGKVASDATQKSPREAPSIQELRDHQVVFLHRPGARGDGLVVEHREHGARAGLEGELAGRGAGHAVVDAGRHLAVEAELVAA